MTRINSGIRPAELCDKMLIAALHECLRVPNKVKAKKYILVNPIPEKFTLNTGHERFFIDKLKYIERYYNEMKKEAVARGFNIGDFSESFIDIPIQYYNDWEPTEEAREIVKERINGRLPDIKNLRYKRQPIDYKQLLIK